MSADGPAHELLHFLQGAGGGVESPTARIEGFIRTALLTGELRGGERLPSVRDVATACGLSRHAASRAYAELAGAELVATRERSGTFVAPVAAPPREPGSATARWLVDVLAQAYDEHRIKLPHLPGLIRSWTGSVRLRVACVESVADLRHALKAELFDHFGIEAECVAPCELDGEGEGDPPPTAPWTADLWVTTTWHAPDLGQVARAHGRAVVAASLHPDTVRAIADRLTRVGEIAIVCMDPTFAGRFRTFGGGRYGSAIRVVPAGEPEAVAALDRRTPVLLTSAAREHLGERADFRLVAPASPLFSPQLTRAVLTHVVRRNLERARGGRARETVRSATDGRSGRLASENP